MDSHQIVFHFNLMLTSKFFVLLMTVYAYLYIISHLHLLTDLTTIQPMLW